MPGVAAYIDSTNASRPGPRAPVPTKPGQKSRSATHHGNRHAADGVADTDRSTDHHAGVDATQPQTSADLGIDELQSRVPEASSELSAARVRQVADLQDGRTQRQ